MSWSRLKTLGALLLMGAPSAAQAQTYEFQGPPMPPLKRSAPWNVLFGGVSRKPIVQLEAGFSELSKLSYHHPVGRDLSIGGAVRFDYGHWAPSDSFSSALGLSAPLRYGLVRGPKWNVALRAEPGLYLGLSQPRFSQTIVGLNLTLGMAVGYRLKRWLMIGGGLEAPLLFGLPTDGRERFVTAPILVGPMAELRISSQWAATADIKIGPHFMSDGFFGTRFGIAALMGLAYQM